MANMVMTFGYSLAQVSCIDELKYQDEKLWLMQSPMTSRSESAEVIMAYIAMAYVGMAYIAMSRVDIAYIAMAE